MSTVLAVNLDDLLRCRAVESARVELKAGWNPKTTGFQVLKTLCAFANDYHNLNGGYVVIGVAEQDGRAALPPSGLDAATVETAQKWIRGNCNRIDPEYQPIMSPEFVSDRAILVLWAPASETKPHRAPDGPGGALKYWIRLGPETVDAEANGMLKGLVEQTARVPWDDRRVHRARIEDLRVAKVREFLRDVRSGLLDVPEAAEIYKGLELAEGRLTGFSKIFRAMEQNGSQPPRFDFDAGRTWFRASLPIHPEYGTASSSWSSTTRATGW